MKHQSKISPSLKSRRNGKMGDVSSMGTNLTLETQGHQLHFGFPNREKTLKNRNGNMLFFRSSFLKSRSKIPPKWDPKSWQNQFDWGNMNAKNDKKWYPNGCKKGTKSLPKRPKTTPRELRIQKYVIRATWERPGGRFPCYPVVV